MSQEVGRWPSGPSITDEACEVAEKALVDELKRHKLLEEQVLSKNADGYPFQIFSGDRVIEVGEGHKFFDMLMGTNAMAIDSMFESRQKILHLVQNFCESCSKHPSYTQACILTVCKSVPPPKREGWLFLDTDGDGIIDGMLNGEPVSAFHTFESESDVNRFVVSERDYDRMVEKAIRSLEACYPF